MGGTSSDAKRLETEDPEDPEALTDDAESDSTPRETIKPAFDVEAYAEEMVGRERLPTITDEAATEEARIASVLMDSTPPAARASAPEIQIGVNYSEVDSLSPEEQLAFLRARLAPMSRVPALKRRITELGPVIEDPKTAYILGFIDGILPLETIVEVAGLPELDTLRILERAVDQHLLTFDRADDR